MGIYNERHGASVSKNTPNGVAGLDSNALVAKGNLPLAGLTEWVLSSSFSSAVIISGCYGNGRHVLAGWNNPILMSSGNGYTWIESEQPFVNEGWGRVIYGNNVFIACTGINDGNAAISSDGINWAILEIPLEYYGGFGLAFGNGIFMMAHRDEAKVAISKDGLTWTEHTVVEPGYGLSCLFYGNGLFVATIYPDLEAPFSSVIYTSPDGITWTAQATPVDSDFVWGYYGGGLYLLANSVPADEDPCVLASEDGINWSALANVPPDMYESLMYGDGVWVIGGDDSGLKIHISTDNGLTWTTRTVSEDGYCGWINYGNGAFVLVDYANEVIYTSSILKNESSYDDGSIKTGALKTEINGSTSGTLIGCQPFQGASYKRVVIYCDALSGSATYTFPTPFAKIPSILADTGLGCTYVSNLTVSEVTVTLPEGDYTGFIILEGF